MSRLSSRLPLFLVLASLVVAGCGGDSGGDKPADPEPEPSVAEFREAADAYCADASDDLLAKTEFGGIAETERFARVAQRIVSRLRTDVALLELPDRFREQRARYTTSLDVIERKLGAVEAAAAERDREGLADALAGLSEKPGEAARAIGLGDCAAFANVVARTP